MLAKDVASDAQCAWLIAAKQALHCAVCVQRFKAARCSATDVCSVSILISV